MENAVAEKIEIAIEYWQLKKLALDFYEVA